MAMTQSQWDRIKDTSLERAANELKVNPIIPSPEHGGWLIYSSKGDGTAYVVKPKHPRSERKGHPSKSKGQYWWLLTCTCPAEGAGFVICWHKSAVYLYWQHCRDVKRMEGVGPWHIQDGPPTDPPPAPTTVQTTPLASTAVGQPTHVKPTRGTKRRAGTPGEGGDPKKARKTR